IHAKRGNYIHLRHGPIFNKFKREYLETLTSYLKKSKENNFFIRVSPLIDKNGKEKDMIKSFGFRDSPIHNMDAEICWILNIEKSEDEILSSMRKSHRYLIKKSQKENIEIIKTENVNKDVVGFLEIYNELAKHRGFVAHKGLVEELEILGQNKNALLILGKYEGKIIGGALIDFAGNMAIYHHGASDDTYRNLSVSYLIQWEAIKEAKKRGKKLYNFWGIASNESKKHPWAGLTLFKTGFGGEKKEFLHAQDLPLSPWYFKTFIIETISRIRKGY
ncbi:MAG TPA: peptidoglycan bridge formation glycyltransferase FemA/FemB family protein, partial [Patescibacteria group bacterium]